MRRSLLLSILASVLLLSACGAGGGGPQEELRAEPADEGIEGVLAYDVGSANHFEGPIDYSLHPPVGGDHNPIWANCGFYDSVVPDENAVHSLEHGAVWIAYSADLADEEKEALAQRVDSDPQGYLLASLYEGIDRPLVLTAWARQLSLDSIDDPRFEEFIVTYRVGPTAPEAGGYCTGGIG